MNETNSPAVRGPLDATFVPLVQRLRMLAALATQLAGFGNVPATVEAAAAEITRLDELADSEGTRAVEYLRRARKAEGEIAALLTLLKDCRTWLDPKTTGDEDSETLCWRIDAAMRHNRAAQGRPNRSNE